MEMGNFFENLVYSFTGAFETRGPASQSNPDGELKFSANDMYDLQDGVLSAENAKNTATYIKDGVVDFGDWCANNRVECALSGADFLPIVGTAARCGQWAVQSLDNDLGEDTAFNCELNAAGDLIPLVGKEIAAGGKAAVKAARGTKAAMTLRLAKTSAAREGLSKAEKEAAQMELGRASKEYTKTVATEIERVEAEIADEALEMEANAAARLEKEEADAFVKFAEKRARDAEVGALVKEAQVELRLQTKAASKVEAKLAQKAEADAADHAAMRRGARENAAKDAKLKPKPKKGFIKQAAKATLKKDLANTIAEPALAVLNCKPDILAGDGAPGTFLSFHDGPSLYESNPRCHETPEKEPEEEEEESHPAQIPPPWESPAPLHPDLWLSLDRPTTASEAGYDLSVLYLGGGLVLLAAGAYAYYKF